MAGQGDFILAGIAGLTQGITKGLQLKQEHDMAQQKLDMEQKHQDLQDSILQKAHDEDVKNSAQLDDPTSVATKLKKGAALSALDAMVSSGSLKKDSPTYQNLVGIINDPQTNGSHLKDFLDSDPQLKLTAAMAEAKMKGDAIVQSSQGKTNSFEARNTGQVSKDYESTMKPYRSLQEDVSKVEAAVSTKGKDGKPLITAQQMGDINATISRIFSPNHMSDATVDRTEYESMPAKFAAAMQKYKANPQDIGSRDLINHILDQAHHLANVSNQNALQELDSLDSGYTNSPSESVKKFAAAKSNFFRQRFSKVYQTVGGNSGQQPGVGANGYTPTPEEAAAELKRRQQAGQ